jgi:hypothetical protein
MKKKSYRKSNQISKISESKPPATKRITMPNGETMEIEINRETMEMLKRRLDFGMGNSFAGLEAFIEAFEKGLYPPDWTIEWIAHAFINYRNHYYRRICQSNGNSKKKSLDDFLGLSSKKRLTDGERDLISDKDTKLFMAVSSLIALDIEPKRAFLEVSKCEGLSHTPGTIRKIFFHYKRIYPNHIDDLKKQTSTWTEADKKEFLSRYNLSK